MLKPVCSAIAICLAITFAQYSCVETYMDEVFHVPQAQKYCSGNFLDWDSKITTFPGLYLLSAAAFSVVSKLLWQLLGIQIRSSVILLRLLNVCISFFSFLLYRACRLKIEPSAGDSTLVAVSLFLYPINFFYYFLFYTDTVSTLSVLIVYYLAFQRRIKHTKQPTKRKNWEERRSWRDFTSYLTGFSSQQLLLVIASSSCVMMRQTNAIWLLFITGTTMITILEGKNGFRDSKTPSFSKLIDFVKKLVQDAPHLATETWPLLLPFIIFVGFVITNKGIVVGDKEHHKPVLHLAMPLHMCVIFTAFMFPSSLGNSYMVRCLRKHGSQTVFVSRKDVKVKDRDRIDNLDRTSDAQTGSDCHSSSDATRQTMYPKIMFVLGHVAGLALVTYILQHHTLGHPFLLADNSLGYGWHYSFYIWSRILSKPKIRYLLSPLYYYCVQWTAKHLIRARGFLWATIFGLALVITLVPAHLFELRYFSPAVVIAVVSSSTPSQCDVEEEEITPKREGPEYHGGEHDPHTKDTVQSDSLLSPCHLHLYFNVCVSCLVNVVTISLFLHKPFIWNDGTTARFMY